jgi:hypothetical protein
MGLLKRTQQTVGELSDLGRASKKGIHLCGTEVTQPVSDDQLGLNL